MTQTLKSCLRPLLPKTLRPHRILAGPLRGRRIVTSWHDYPGAISGRTERALLDWFSRNVRSGETWLDVGAHYGYTAIALSSLVGPRGRVFAFEPMLATAGCLARTRWLNRLPQLTIVPVALGSPTDSSELCKLPPVRGMVDVTAPAGEWSETILVVRLDWLWPRISGDCQRIDGIKIDVQGMELQTLRGMCDLLRTSAPHLVIEFHRGVDRGTCLDLIAAQGYAPRGTPIDATEPEGEPLYLDDRSYAFPPARRSCGS